MWRHIYVAAERGGQMRVINLISGDRRSEESLETANKVAYKTNGISMNANDNLLQKTMVVCYKEGELNYIFQLI